MSRSRRATAALTAAAAMLALSAGFSFLARCRAPRPLPPPCRRRRSEGSSIHAKTTTARKVRVILPSMYDLAPLGSAVPSSLAAGEAVATISDLPLRSPRRAISSGLRCPVPRVPTGPSYSARTSQPTRPSHSGRRNNGRVFCCADRPSGLPSGRGRGFQDCSSPPAHRAGGGHPSPRRRARTNMGS
jgi:hypothetical protein